MSQFRFQGIAEALAAQVRSSMRSPQYGHPAHRELAQGYGPCRVCLRSFAVGKDERILFTYQPFLDPGSLPVPGPVFIHARECARYDAPELPPDLRSLPLVFEAYRAGGELIADVIDPAAMPAPQHLERGSSVTHNSLVANQRPHISLIDRRHFDDVALPIGMPMRSTTSAYVKRNAVARPLTALSHINVRVLPRRAEREAARHRRRSTTRC